MKSWATLNVTGERTTGTAPMYGRILSLHSTREAAEDTVHGRDPHQYRWGQVAANGAVGQRVRYVGVTTDATGS